MATVSTPLPLGAVQEKQSAADQVSQWTLMRWRFMQNRLSVAALIVLPQVLGGTSTRDVGVVGAAPAELSGALGAQGEATDAPVRVHRYATRAAGEAAVRNRDVDVLVVDGRQLEWPGRVDEQLRIEVTAAIQRLAVQQRAVASGLSRLVFIHLADRCQLFDAGK